LSKKIYIGLLLLCAPAVASANVAWPAVTVSQGLHVWWVIAAGLVVEWIAIKWLFKLSFWRTTLVDVTANAASALLGLFLIPLFGLAFELIPEYPNHWPFSWNTLFLAKWVSAFILAAAVNLVIELLVMRKVFKLPASRRATLVVFAANLVTVSMAIVPVTQVLKRGY
jgi:hypothetical protein